jgi:hypothetical protein
VLQSAGHRDAFVASYGADGGFRWAFNLGSEDDEDAYAVDVEADAVFVGGSFGGAVDFDPGPGEAALTASAFDVAYVAAYTLDGGYRTAFGLGTTGENFARGLDAEGDRLSVVGSFAGTVDFDPGPGPLVLTSNGDGDAYVATYPFSFVTAAEPAAPSPAGLALSAPVPNPAVTRTTLVLMLNVSRVVRVEVLDALGRRVAVLHDGILAAGTHPLSLDGARLPGGVYVVRAVGGGEVVARRVTVRR